MSNLTEQQKQEKIKRFKAMGIPVPLEPIVNSGPINANPEKLKVLEQIKRGALKSTFNEIIEADGKKNDFKPIGDAKQKKSNAPVKTIAEQTKTEVNPEAAAIERMMFGEGMSTPSNVSNISIHQTTNDVNFDEYMGAVPNNENKLLQLKQKIEMAKAQGSMAVQPVQTSTVHAQRPINEMRSGNDSTYIGTPAGTITMSEAEFTKNVTSIALEASKKMIKQVILEYVKEGKDIIVESKRIKKAEIIAKNKIKIDGKVYKVTLDTE